MGWEGPGLGREKLNVLNLTKSTSSVWYGSLHFQHFTNRCLTIASLCLCWCDAIQAGICWLLDHTLPLVQHVKLNNTRARFSKHKVVLLQRDQATCFVTRNNKSDLQTHSRSLVFVPFDRPYMISYLSSIVTISVPCTILETLLPISQNCKRSHDHDHSHWG